MADLRLPRWGRGVTRSNTTASDGYCSPPKYLSELFMWPTVDSGFCCFPSNPAQTALVWSSLWSQMNWWIHHFGSVFWFSLWFRLISRENTSFISRLTPLLRWPSHWNLDLHRTHFFLKFVNVSASCSAWGWWGVLSRECVGVLVGWEMGCKLTQTCHVGANMNGWQSTMSSSSGREFGRSASSGVDKESFSRLYRSRDSGRNLWVTCWCSVAQLSLTLRSHGLQHARPPCPSPSPRVFANSYPLSQWCHPIISSSVVPFSSCPQSFPASGSFPMTSYLPLLSKEQASDQTPRLLPRVQLGHFDDDLIFKPEGPLGMLSGKGWQSWV